jgi:hypothetical protein
MRFCASFFYELVVQGTAGALPQLRKHRNPEFDIQSVWKPRGPEQRRLAESPEIQAVDEKAFR